MIADTEKSALFPFFATGWAMLWAVLSLLDGRFQLEGPRGVGIPIIIIFSGWLFAWLRSDALAVIADGQPGRWTLAAVGSVPVIAFAILPLIDHGKHSAAHDTGLVTTGLKVVLFGSSWGLFLLGRKDLTSNKAAAPEKTWTAPPPPPHRPRTDTLLVSIGDVLRPVSWHQIVWLEADGNYVRIFTHNTDYFYRRSLGDLIVALGEDRFVRVHKSRAVNVAEIVGIQPLAKGDADLHLRDGRKVRMSRRYRGDLPMQSGSP